MSENNASTHSSAHPVAGTVGKISVLTLTMINIAAVVSLRGLPSEAEYGLGSIFYYVFAALVFLIPVSLISAELAASLPEKGGVYRWVGEAYGTRMGFLATWLQWIQNAIWFPTVLTFAAVSIAYIGANPSSSNVALASNKIYVAIVCLVIYWGATLINLKGMSAAAKISKYGGMIGTIIPAAILIIFGIAWLVSGHPLQMDTNIDTLFPNLSNLNNLVLASSVFLFFAGMEMSAVHVKEIDNPQKNYPKAIIISAIICVVIFVLGTLAIAFVLPAKSINLTQSLLVAFDTYLKTYHLRAFTPVIAIMLVFGVIAGVSTWIGGPSKSLLVIGCHGMLPPFLQKTNKNGVQINILMVQGVIVTILVMLFTFLPSVQAVYQILSQLTSILYLTMYVMLFLAGMKLRKKYPNLKRPFMVPGGKVGIYIFGVVGVIGAVMAGALSFLPPSQIDVGSKDTWYMVLIIGYIVFVGLPLVIYALRKPSWVNESAANAVEPFMWEKAEAAAKEQAKVAAQPEATAVSTGNVAATTTVTTTTVTTTSAAPEAAAPEATTTQTTTTQATEANVESTEAKPTGTEATGPDSSGTGDSGTGKE